ncbi:hypothetical protein ABIB81_009313 [Bradyrhizobium sp. I1.7.5]
MGRDANNLDQVAAVAPKRGKITNVRITLQALLNQTRKARVSGMPIGMGGRKPHPQIHGMANHRRSSTSTTRASAPGQFGHPADASPVPTSIWICPFRAAGKCRIRQSSFYRRGRGKFAFSGRF